MSIHTTTDKLWGSADGRLSHEDQTDNLQWNLEEASTPPMEERRRKEEEAEGIGEIPEVASELCLEDRTDSLRWQWNTEEAVRIGQILGMDSGLCP